MQKAEGALRALSQLEELSSGTSPIHGIHPAAKLVAALCHIVMVVSCPRLDIPALSLYFFYPALLIALSGTPVRAVVKRVLPALPFVLFAGVSNLFFEPPAQGLTALAVLLLKAALTVSAVVILMATTPSARLFAALRKFGAPRAFVTVLMLGMRYLTLIAGEAGRMARAYRLRSGTDKGIELRDMGAFVGQLLLRSVDRAERVYAAMKLRGYDGEYPVEGARMDGAGWAFLGVACALSILFRFFTVEDLMKLWM